MAKAGIVYVGTSDGVVVFSDPASIGRWRRIGHELQGSEVHSLLAHSALRIDVALGAAGMRHSDDGGQSWNGAGHDDVVLLAAHPAAPETLFAASASGDVRRSDDNGVSWTVCPQGDRPNEPISALLVDPHNAQHLLIALRRSGVWTSVDAGKRWDALGAGLPTDVERIVVSPNRPNRLFAVAGGNVWQAGDSGLWTASASPLAVAPGGGMAVLPGANEALIVATTGPDRESGLVRSTDDGDTWQSATVDDPLAASVRVIIPATYHLDTAWAGTDDGRLLLSDDRGRSWHTVAHDLAPIHAIAAVRLA